MSEKHMRITMEVAMDHEGRFDRKAFNARVHEFAKTFCRGKEKLTYLTTEEVDTQTVMKDRYHGLR
jgi:hypothetical protein